MCFIEDTCLLDIVFYLFYLGLQLCTEVGIYKRKQESKKIRKQELDQESDEESKKKERKQDLEQEKKKENKNMTKKKINF